jgi:hypothetical protein
MPRSARSRPALEIALLRRGVGELAAGRCRCQVCRRTPLIGERIHVYEDGRTLCALCRRRRREEPVSTEVVRSSEYGHAVKLRPAA